MGAARQQFDQAKIIRAFALLQQLTWDMANDFVIIKSEIDALEQQLVCRGRITVDLKRAVDRCCWRLSHIQHYVVDTKKTK